MRVHNLLIEPESSQIRNDWEFPYIAYKKKPIIVGLTGPTKSGKTIMAERLVVNHGFEYINLASMIADLAIRQGKVITGWRDIGDAGIKHRELKGEEVFAQLTMEKVRMLLLSHNRIVIDGILHPSEMNYFLRHPFFTVIGIDSKFSTRLNAAKSWYKNEKLDIEKELMDRDDFEQYSRNRSDGLAPNIGMCLGLARDRGMVINVKRFDKKTVFDQIEEKIQSIIQQKF